MDCQEPSQENTPSSLKQKLWAWIRLETGGLTAAYWGALMVTALAFVACPYPPMIDYPQHVAMGAILRQLMDPQSPAHGLFQTNLFTYNAGIETAIALLSLLVRPELAGRLLLGLHAILFGIAAKSLCDVAGRPRWYSLFVFPLIYNHITGWGFANFVFALPFAVLALSHWIRLVQGKWNWARVAGVLGLTMLVAYTHVLVMLSICVAVATVFVVDLIDRGTIEQRLSRAKAFWGPGLVLAPSVLYSLGAWYWARATSTTVWEHAWAEGQDDPLWYKLRYLLHFSTGNYANESDQNLVALSLWLAVAVWLGAKESKFERRVGRLGLVFFLLYLVVPKVFIATFHIYPRFLPLAALFTAAALPVVCLKKRWVKMIASGAALVAVAASANTLYHFLTIPEMEEAMAILDDAPANRSLVGVTFEPRPRTFLREIWVHLPAIYQARRGGLIAYSFLRNESVPVHYLPGKEPPHPPGGFEWNGRLYDPAAPYARAYDLMLVRSWLGPDGLPVDPTDSVLGGLAGGKLLSKRGRFFLYDVSGVQGDKIDGNVE